MQRSSRARAPASRLASHAFDNRNYCDHDSRAPTCTSRPFIENEDDDTTIEEPPPAQVARLKVRKATPRAPGKATTAFYLLIYPYPCSTCSSSYCRHRHRTPESPPPCLACCRKDGAGFQKVSTRTSARTCSPYRSDATLLSRTSCPRETGQHHRRASSAKRRHSHPTEGDSMQPCTVERCPVKRTMPGMPPPIMPPPIIPKGSRKNGSSKGSRPIISRMRERGSPSRLR